MPFAKVTMFFEDPEGYGSSESYYTSYSGDVSSVLPLAQTLFKTRMGLMGVGMAGVYLRVSDDSIQGDAEVDTTTYFAGQAPGSAPSVGGNQKNPSVIKGGDPEAPPCLPNLVLSGRFQIGSTYHAIKYFHGLPTSVITTPPGPNFTGDFIGQWRAWTKLFQGPQTTWLLKVKLKTGSSVKTPVTQIVGQIPNPAIISAPGHQIANGQKFVLGGFKGLQGVRGTYIAASVVAGVSLQVASGVPIANVLVPNKGYVQAVNYDYLPITSLQPDEETFHKAGRPFGQRPGRRKVSRSK